MSIFGVSALVGRFSAGWLLDCFHVVPVAMLLAPASVLALILLTALVVLAAATPLFVLLFSRYPDHPIPPPA